MIICFNIVKSNFKRTCQLFRNVYGDQKMFTRYYRTHADVQLCKLEDSAVVKRTVHAEEPERVMYELTELCYQLRPINEELGEDNVPSRAIGQRDAAHVLQHGTTGQSM